MIGISDFYQNFDVVSFGIMMDKMLVVCLKDLDVM